MSKEQQQKVHYAFIRDDERSKLGFISEEVAKTEFDSLKVLEGDDTRVRLRYRSRTDRWDVVVKTRREVKN